MVHLTDKESGDDLYQYYTNAKTGQHWAHFSYVFEFDGHEVEYSYYKISHKVLSGERLKVDDQLVLLWPVGSEQKVYCEPNFQRKYQFGVIPIHGNHSSLSAVKYIFNNMVSANDSILENLKSFVNGMLWFQRNDASNRYIGFASGVGNINEYIVNHALTEKFQDFLNDHGVDEKLVSETAPDGRKYIYFSYERKIPFAVAASSGTKALQLLYYWLKHEGNISFLFIDEFDAFYHYALSEKVLSDLVNKFKGQAIVTTHNIHLLNNRIIRPDCCLKLESGRVVSFTNLTDRKLWQGNNLENLYMGGEFDG